MRVLLFPAKGSFCPQSSTTTRSVEESPKFANYAGLNFRIGAPFLGKVFEGGIQLGFIAPVAFQGLLAGPVALGNGSWPVVAEFYNLGGKLRPRL